MNRTLVCCAAMSMFCSLMLAGCKTQSSAPAPREPLPVDIVAVKAADEAHWLETIGQAEAAAAVSVTTQATGRIIAQRYTEGDFVEAGAVLFEIDPANLKTQLASAEASRRALEVEFAQADREFQRAEKLWKAQAASQKDYDDAKSLKNTNLHRPGLPKMKPASIWIGPPYVPRHQDMFLKHSSIPAQLS